jgi:2-hydroxychromene-2-carboxylate isomerase
MRRVEFMFDFGSPNAYLAETFIPEVERRTERTLREARRTFTAKSRCQRVKARVGKP